MQGAAGPRGGVQMLCHVGTYVLEGPGAFINCPEGPQLDYISYMEVIFTKLGGLESGGQVTLK